MNALSPNTAPRNLPSLRSEAIRVLIAEDTAMGCQLLKEGLKRSPLGLGDIYCTVTASQVVGICDVHAVDVALISEDLQDGAHKGIDAVELLRKAHPNVRSVVLIRRVRRELTLEAFRNGAKGVFCRKEPIETLGKCILAVHKGQVWADSEQLEVLLQALVEAKPVRVTNLQGACLLTQREDQVAVLVAEGLTNREVARRLGLREHTVSNYLFKIYEKLGISSRMELALYIFAGRQKDLASVRPSTVARDSVP